MHIYKRLYAARICCETTGLSWFEPTLNLSRGIKANDILFCLSDLDLPTHCRTT